MKYSISLYIIFHVILDSILFNRARSISVRRQRVRRKTTPTPVVHVVASPLYTVAALGYACIQIRQRGGRICRINSAGGIVAGGWLALPLTYWISLKFIRRGKLSHAPRMYRRTSELIGLPCYYKRRRVPSLTRADCALWSYKLNINNVHHVN